MNPFSGAMRRALPESSCTGMLILKKSFENSTNQLSLHPVVGAVLAASALAAVAASIAAPALPPRILLVLVSVPLL